MIRLLDPIAQRSQGQRMFEEDADKEQSWQG
jgi:hypothetical protein